MTQWTKDPPTEPGWYWWRNDFKEPMIHEIAFICQKCKTLYAIRRGDNTVSSLSNLEGEWGTKRIPEPLG